MNKGFAAPAHYTKSDIHGGLVVFSRPPFSDRGKIATFSLKAPKS